MERQLTFKNFMAEPICMIAVKHAWGGNIAVTTKVGARDDVT